MDDQKQDTNQPEDKKTQTEEQKPAEAEVKQEKATSAEEEQKEVKETAADTQTEAKSEKKPKEDPPVEEKSVESSNGESKTEAESKPPTKTVKGAHWYVVHTYSGHEAKVSNTLKQRIDSLKLQDKVVDILIPTQEKIEIKEGKKSTVKEKIFPGYLLVHMLLDDNTWLAVRTTPGVTGFIGTSTKPTPLPESEVASIKKYMSMEAPKFKATFTEGEAIKITDGPFSEFLGTISEIDEEKGKLKVMVSVFGRETPVELDLLQVAKL